MLCRCSLPTLNGGDRGGGEWILMFSEVTLFEYNVSTIVSPIVGSAPPGIEEAWHQVVNQPRRVAESYFSKI